MAAELIQVQKTGVDTHTFATLHSSKGSTKESGLYNFISQLLKNKSWLIHGLRIDTASAEAPHQAHYIHLERADVTPLYDSRNYRFCKRHLTIDKYFKLESSSQAMSGFTYVNYTEKYEILSDTASGDEPEVKQFITVHAYINTQGHGHITILKI